MGLFGKVRAAWDWNVLGIKLGRAKDVISKELEMSEEAKAPEAPKAYDVKKSLVKGATTLAIYAAALAIGAVATAFADSNLIAGKLEAAGLSAQVSAAVGGVIAFVATAVRNWAKNRKLGQENEG